MKEHAVCRAYQHALAFLVELCYLALPEEREKVFDNCGLCLYMF